MIVSEGAEVLKAVGKGIESMFGSCRIVVPTPIGYLEHEPTKAQISVYSKIRWFKRLMLKWCFGLKYVKRD